MVSNSWNYNNLLEARQPNQHYNDPNKIYHYWNQPLTYDYLVSIQDNDESMFYTIYKHFIKAYYGENIHTYEEYLANPNNLRKNTERWIKEYAKEVLSKGQSDEIPLYRALLMYSGKRFNPRELGVCWAWDVSGMTHFMDSLFYENRDKISNARIITLEATTTKDNIDWAESIFLHLYYGEEHELRLYNPQKLNLIKKDIYKVYGYDECRAWENKIYDRINK